MTRKVSIEKINNIIVKQLESKLIIITIFIICNQHYMVIDAVLNKSLKIFMIFYSILKLLNIKYYSLFTQQSVNLLPLIHYIDLFLPYFAAN